MSHQVLEDLPLKRRQEVPVELDAKALKDLQANLKAMQASGGGFEVPPPPSPLPLP